MLSRIIRLAHVGLYHNGTPTPLQFRKATLIYGENGRGKSTLASVLDSCARGRPQLILDRSTIDQVGAAPTVELIFDTGAQNVTFRNGAWSSRRDEIRVFDSTFVHENVHTGMAVTTENRRGLYEFALGDAVGDMEEMDRLAREQQAAARLRGERQRAVNAQAAPLSFQDFVALQPDANIDGKIDDTRKWLLASSRAAQIVARQDLLPLEVPRIDLEAIFTGLRRTIDDVHVDAERLMRAHLAKHPQRGFEDWASRGRQYEQGGECPYCGQNVDNADLLKAYQQYFSEGYGQLKTTTQALRNNALQQLEPGISIRWATMVETNRARQDAWNDLLPSEALPIDIRVAGAQLDGLRTKLGVLFERKQAAPLESCGSDEEIRAVSEHLLTLSAQFQAYNDNVATINANYAARKREVVAGDISTLSDEIRRLEAVKKRFTPAVAAEVELYRQADAAAAVAAQNKETLRRRHDQTMRETLVRYEAAINRRLDSMRAGFRIVELTGRHDAGQIPRTSYAVELRGRTITELEQTRNGHSFPTALSDGDRRSLALAFFLARLDVDPQLANRVVLFDDPMASFDENRKSETVRALRSLAGQCEQLIVLSHDAHFLRDLLEDLQSDDCSCISHKIGFADREYAHFETCDLQELCKLPYFDRYLRVAQYLSGQRPGQARQVAENLRVLIEEYYKLRYPGHVTETMTLGNIIAEIRRAPAGSALAAIQALTEHLDAFNEYASQYHHSNPNYRTEPLQERELRHFARAALSLIQNDGRTYPVNP